MRRLELHAYGPLRDALRLADAADPVVGDNDVLIHIEAAAINPIDFKIANGALRKIMTLKLPAALGFDGCGTVISIGSAVRAFTVGQRVYVRAPRRRMGSFAELLAVDARFVANAPSTLSSSEAASLPLVALTTVQALVDRAQAKPGQCILIHAGSGGLGTFAVQYAKHVLGLQVTTTTSSRNVDWVRSLGADRVIAYDQHDYRSDRARYDIVFDTLGGSATHDAFGVLKAGGVVVSVAGPPDAAFARQVDAGPLLTALLWLMGARTRFAAWRRGARYFRFLTESNGSQLDAIRAQVEAGRVRPVIDREFPFDQAIAALEYTAKGHAKGKVVLRMTANDATPEVEIDVNNDLAQGSNA